MIWLQGGQLHNKYAHLDSIEVLVQGEWHQVNQHEGLRFDASVARALKDRIIDQSAPLELGALLKSSISENAKIIIADFSGIGAQDVAMAEKETILV